MKCKRMFDMKNVISVVGAAIVASVVGSFMMFECPFETCVPKPALCSFKSPSRKSLENTCEKHVKY